MNGKKAKQLRRLAKSNLELNVMTTYNNWHNPKQIPVKGEDGVTKYMRIPGSGKPCELENCVRGLYQQLKKLYYAN